MAVGTDKIGIVVTVSEAALERLREVEAALRGAGMDVEQVLDAIGAVTGFASPGQIEIIRRVPGVAAVEASREIRLPPPGSPVQ
jgi:hypothetical protein